MIHNIPEDGFFYFIKWSLYFCIKWKLVWAGVQKSTLDMYVMLNINSFIDLSDTAH